MDRKVLVRRWLQRAILSFVILLPAGSCVDNKYDLDKDISWDVNLGGEHLTIPIGYTDSIKLSKLFDLDDDAILTTMPNGEYRIQISDAVNSSSFRVASVILDDIVSSAGGGISPVQQLAAAAFAGDNGQMQQLELDPVDIDVTDVIPNEIRKLVSATFETSGNQPAILLKIAFSGLPSNLDEIGLVDFKVRFPAFLSVTPKEGDITDHVYTINKRIPVSNGVAILRMEFLLKSFDFERDNDVVHYDASTDQTQLNLHDQIAFSGAIQISNSNIALPDLDQIVVRQEFSASGLKIKSVSGIVNPNIEAIQKSISLEGLPDFILEDGVVLDVEHPVIKVSVENPVNVPMTVDAVLKGEKRGAIDNQNVVNARFDILSSGEAGSKLTNVWISDDETGKPADYLAVHADLSGLIKNVPDDVNIELAPKAQTSGEALHSIDLGHNYQVKVNYQVDVPLRFGDEFRIVYKDVLDNMQDDLGDVFERITSVVIILDVENYIPLNMDLTVKPVDKSGRDLSNELKVSTTGQINAAVKDLSQPLGTSASKTKFEIKISEKTEGALSRLEGLAFDVAATSDGATAGCVLNEKQFLKISGKIKLPEGIRLDLNDL